MTLSIYQIVAGGFVLWLLGACMGAIAVALGAAEHGVDKNNSLPPIEDERHRWRNAGAKAPHAE